MIGASYAATVAGGVETPDAQAGLLRAARESLQAAVNNTDPAGHAQVGRPVGRQQHSSSSGRSAVRTGPTTPRSA
ncbi:DUF6245 family protein [Streptomyces sp. NBC_01320]|uniref:DUF6245 family protein n=1 Tax=Streptomyces sp. NBC_01320 TaxID=2903824 RepID=UPI003FA3D02C